jgi:hypothetical protein
MIAGEGGKAKGRRAQRVQRAGVGPRAHQEMLSLK